MLNSFNTILFNLIVGILLIFVLAFILAFAVGFVKVAKEEKIKKEQEKTKKISFKNNEKD